MADAIELPGYQVLGELGRGAMGVVYAARQSQLGRQVAVKVIPRVSAEDSAGKRFMREAQLCLALSHPRVVKILDCGETAQWMYIAMELVRGRSLDKVVAAAGPLPPPQLFAAMEQLADALDFVHSKNIVHRDIKPANVMMAEGDGVKLMDFGLARGEGNETLTGQGVLVGSPRYLAPEAILKGIMDPGTDLYTLGFTFYEIATGTLPYHGHDLRETFRRIIQEKLPPPSRHALNIPASIDRIILGLLEKDREKRIPSARALLDQIRELRASPEFFGTSWQTSQAQLDCIAEGSAALDQALGAVADTRKMSKVPIPSKPGTAASTTRTARPSRRITSVSVAVAPPGAPAGTRTALMAAGAALAGLAVVVGLYLAIARAPGPAASASPVAPPPSLASGAPSPGASAAAVESAGTRPAVLLIEALHSATAALDLRTLIDGFESDLLPITGGPKKSTSPERQAKIERAREAAITALRSARFVDAWAQLARAKPFDDPAKLAPSPLADATLDLAVRRHAYEALLVLSHLDDYFDNRLGIGPAFGSQRWLDPWARLADLPGRDRADVERPCHDQLPGARCVFIHHNDWEVANYLFSGLHPVAEQQVLVAGPVGNKYSKHEDVPSPRVELAGPYREIDLFALVQDLDRLRFFRIEFTDANKSSHVIVLRSARAFSVDESRVVSLRLSAEALPPGTYEVHIRAYRLTGVEDGGIHLKDLFARLRP